MAKTTTIPPWTRMECSECGCDSQATRTEPKAIIGPYVCSDCKLVEQAGDAAEQAAYERVARWHEAGCPIAVEWTRATKAEQLRPAYIRAGLPGFTPA
jgi:hypothetical protein